MQNFSQDKSNFIGSQNSILELSNKEQASILIVSDTHGNFDLLERIIFKRGKKNDALILCGDTGGDLAKVHELYAHSANKENFPSVCAFVRGNNDYDIYPFYNIKKKKDPTLPYYCDFYFPENQIIKIAGHNIFITHGHKYTINGGSGSLETAALKNKCRIAFFGHTHIACSILKEKIFLLNPGSTTFPRNGQNPSFAEITLYKNVNNFMPTFFDCSKIDDEGNFSIFQPESCFI